MLDDAWLELVQERELQVGISLDGPASLHDSRRRTRGGAGTFERTMRGVRRLRDARLPFHVITLVSDATLDRADELYDFYSGEGIDRVCFNVEEIEGAHRASTLAGREAIERFARFLDRFVVRILADGGRLWLRELAGALDLVRDAAPSANPQTTPFSIVNVAVDGDVATFSPELLGFSDPRYGRLVIGNVHRDTLETLAASPVLAAMTRDIQRGVQACRERCPWFDWCGGGAPANKLFETGRLDSTETMFCRLAKQTVLAVIVDRLASFSSNPLPAYDNVQSKTDAETPARP